MPPPVVIVTYGAKDFRSGLTVTFTVYDLGGTLRYTSPGLEVGTVGVYYVSIPALPKGHYICGVSEPTGFWRAYKELIF